MPDAEEAANYYQARQLALAPFFKKIKNVTFSHGIIYVHEYATKLISFLFEISGNEKNCC
jgi:hypothetical protein